MKLLITNDDGISSPFLTFMADALSREHDVVVVAPSQDQSGMSHAFTHGLEKRLSYQAEALQPYPRYEVAGTPSDCIKFAVASLLKGERIDMVISGVNVGENAGMSAIYSGTVAAAREGAMWGIPALALSIWKYTPARLEHAVRWLLELLRRPELLPDKSGGLWNVNFPPCEPDQVEGVEITSMSTVMFEDGYEPSLSEHGLTRFRLTGRKPPQKFREGTDDFALSRNRIAVTPLQLTQSHAGELRRLAALEGWDSLCAVPASGGLEEQA